MVGSARDVLSQLRGDARLAEARLAGDRHQA
jgi:hypothetical protein